MNPKHNNIEQADLIKKDKNMNVLVIGSGGREHSLVWKLSQSEKVDKIYIASGNPGTAELGENVDIEVCDIDALKEFAITNKIDLTVVGPEAPLTAGIVDIFEEADLLIFGPSLKASELEASKVFTKDLFKKYAIPTAEYKTFSNSTEAMDYVSTTHLKDLVIKADGLCGGKGVIICHSRQEAMDAVHSIMKDKEFGAAGLSIVVEEFLTGEEASFFALTDGHTVLPLTHAQDHKQIFDNDEGPNTGGMGAYTPAPVITEELYNEVMTKIIHPTVDAMRSEGRTYKGVLYAGLMITKDGVKTLEYNIRFGDPECQPIMMRLESDLFDLLYSVANGTLDKESLKWSDKTALTVVMASEGYPKSFETGNTINGIDEANKLDDVVVFHGGTAENEDGDIVNSGGRVLNVTALGDNVKEAKDKAYEAVSKISWSNSYNRTDIGDKAIK